ncbi:MAG: dihydroxy-acid dehydratase [Pseudomonadota bacterium]
MIAGDDGSENKVYAPWSWIAGYALAVGIMMLMFSLAAGFAWG